MTFPFPRLRKALLALALTCGSAPARAESQLDLKWEAPPECPTEAAVLERLRSLAGKSLRESRLQATGRIVRSDGRYRLTLTLRQGDDVRQRRMESLSCEDLTGAAAVALGLLLQRQQGTSGSTATNERSADEGARGAETRGDSRTPAADQPAASEQSGAAARSGATTSSAKPPETPRKSEPAPSRAEARAETAAEGGAKKRTPNIVLRAPFGTLDLVELPRPAVTLGAGVGVGFREWRVIAIGRIFSDQTVWSPPLPNVGARVALVEGELWGCREWRRGAIEGGPCVNVGVSELTARGAGPHVVPRTRHAALLALGAAADGRVFLQDWLAIFGSLTLAVEASRPRLSVDAYGEAQQIGPVDVAAALGTEWIF